MPRNQASQPQTNISSTDLPPEVFARIITKLAASQLADFRLVCKQFAMLGKNDATLMWLHRHFPATTQAVLSEQQQGPMTFAQNKINEINIQLTKEHSDLLLPEQIMPFLLELQQYDLEPLYRNFEKINERASSSLVSRVKAILPELGNIFLWIKTGNMAQLNKVKWTDLNILWLLNNLDRNHLSAFDWAQISGNQELLDLFYNKASRLMYLSGGFGAFPNGVFDPRYQTNILQLAIRCNHSPQQLLKAVYAVDVVNMISLKNTSGENSLHFAARSINSMWLEYLLTNLSDKERLQCLEQKNSAGLTPLHVAAQLGNWRAVSLLAAYKANTRNLNAFLYEAIDLEPQERKTTRFHVAAQCLSLKHFKELLTNAPYFKVDTPDHNGSTLLHIACARGNLSLVEELILHKNANCLLANDAGWTALHFAIAGNHINVVKYLLKEIKDLSKIKPTHDGWYLSHILVKYGDVKMINLFKAQIIAELNTRNGIGDIPLALAIKEGRYELVQGLLSILPPTQHVPAHCLHLAATSKDPSCLAQLVSRVISVDTPDSYGNTALHLAAGSGNVRGVLCLLNANAKTNLLNEKGKLAEYYAKESGNNLLINLFACLRYGKNIGSGFWEKKTDPRKVEAARALENVLLGKAEYAAIEPYMDLFSVKASKTLSRFYKAFLPIIAPYSKEQDEPQAGVIASSSNSKI
ncbi:ankyrin repeat domain-containing protein [Legionella saoudiensis]|uniref:ankyrin repeat domain-containing protein n=1 Tax=Legionella saoudiensis TaxID=1750561 RepID=UPI00072FA7AC|nr:ankyrin repeat domain-containing protein [Legionella saoudiensis]